jgi:outer membrane receptor protein involved in Fe transport
VDARTQEPLEGATILAESQPFGTETNALGFFSLHTDLPLQAMIVSYLGYETRRILIDPAKRFFLIELIPVSIQLDQVTVSELPDPLTSLVLMDTRLRGVNSSQEILRSVPGLIIAQHAGGGKAEQIFLRGFDIDHGTDISITVDGLPVNMVSHAHGQGYADLHFLIPELIQRVTFGKGPHSAARGNFATAGFVEFTTPDFLEQEMIKVEVGRFNTKRLLAMNGLLGEKARENGQFAYLATEFMQSDGPFESPQHFNRLNLQGKYTYRMPGGEVLRLGISTFRSKWDASGQIPERAVDAGLISRFGAIDSTEGGNTARSNFWVELVRPMQGDAFLSQKIYWTAYDFELYSNFTFFLNDPVNGDQIRQKEARNILGYQGRYEKNNTLGPFKLTGSAGWGLRYDQVRGNELSRTRNRSETLARLALGDVNEINAFAFIEETIRFSQRWTLDAGLRFDFFRAEYNDQLKLPYLTQAAQRSFLGPKFNLAYDWRPNWQWFLKSGIGFHSNDTRVVVAQQGLEILPAAYGIDLGANIKPASRILVHLAAWMLHLQQEFVYVGDEAIVEPSGRTRRLGLDFSARYQIGEALFADFDLNSARGRSLDEPEGQNAIPLAPRLTSAGGLTLNRAKGWNANLRYRYVQDRPANPEGTITALGYFLIDAGLSYQLPKWALSLRVENLLDSDWNEAQFDTESRLQNEFSPVSELHFTPGNPFFFKFGISWTLGKP